VELDRYIVAEDCGHTINPRIVDRQVHGAVAQGIGRPSEQPRRQRGRSASQGCATARISHGAVRNDCAVAMQDPDIFDPGAEFVGNHLCERGLEPLAM
jgi:hypothetical protein